MQPWSVVRLVPMLSTHYLKTFRDKKLLEPHDIHYLLEIKEKLCKQKNQYKTQNNN